MNMHKESDYFNGKNTRIYSTSKSNEKTANDMYTMNANK